MHPVLKRAPAALAVVLAFASLVMAEPVSAEVATFSVSLAPSSAAVAAGSTATAKLSTTSLGASGSLGLTAKGAPSSVAVSFSDSKPLIGASVEVSFATSTRTVAGTYLVALTAMSGTEAHSTEFALTVVDASTSALITLVAGFAPKVTGEWKGALPADCPAKDVCTARYPGVPQGYRFGTLVLGTPDSEPLPSMSFEIIRLIPPSPLMCSSTGSVGGRDPIRGEAMGPWPGPALAHIGIGAIDRTSERDASGMFTRGFTFLYSVPDDGSDVQGQIDGEILTPKCDAAGHFRGGRGSGRYNMFSPLSGQRDTGTVEVIAPGWPEGGPISISFTSNGLPASASVSAPDLGCFPGDAYPPDHCPDL